MKQNSKQVFFFCFCLFIYILLRREVYLFLFKVFDLDPMDPPTPMTKQYIGLF
jgi:hypothetical protein